MASDVAVAHRMLHEFDVVQVACSDFERKDLPRDRMHLHMQSVQTASNSSSGYPTTQRLVDLRQTTAVQARIVHEKVVRCRIADLREVLDYKVTPIAQNNPLPVRSQW